MEINKTYEYNAHAQGSCFLVTMFDKVGLST